MKIKQQDLLKKYIKEAKLTREEFVKRFDKEGVTTRALASWLLPSSSSGFRTMPDGLHKTVSDDLISYLQGSVYNISLPEDFTDEDMVIFKDNGEEIYFPPIWYLDGYYEFPEGRNYCQEISFSPIFMNNPNFTLETATRHDSAKQFGGDNYWVYINRYDTAREACAVGDNVIITQDDEYLALATLTVKFKNHYFVLFIKPAPKWHDAPLFIYSSKTLGVSKILGNEVYLNLWQAIIDPSGDLVEMPLMETGD